MLVRVITALITSVLLFAFHFVNANYTVTKCHPIMRPSYWSWATGNQTNSGVQGNKCQFLGEQRNKYSIGIQGTYKKTCYLKGAGRAIRLFISEK